MRIRILGGGWYGSHLAVSLIAAGHQVELHEIADRLFAGASGGNPARCHLGFHYPRSAETRDACLGHHREFMASYGHLTRSVPVNIYAIAAEASLVDFGTYRKILKGEVEFVTIPRPEEFGLQNVEGALLTGERHVVIDRAREHFEEVLSDNVCFKERTGNLEDVRWDMTIDCTFNALDADRIDRYEPCVTTILEGPADRAVTIMDGPFPSIYPWDEARGLSSLTSAKFTPLSKVCKSYDQAKAILNRVTDEEVEARSKEMLQQISEFWPAAWDRYSIVGHKLTIRAMPKSAADTRLASVERIGSRAMRVRAGKIDAVFHAERLVHEMLLKSRVRQ
jgi:hypothetical protein